MTLPDEASRRAGAAAAVAQLIEIVRGHGPGTETWYRTLLDLRDVLADSTAPDQASLNEASAMFDSLYAGPRNFSEFNIWREDEAERLRENRRVESIIRDLETNLRGELSLPPTI
jgi:hypothetical protein